MDVVHLFVAGGQTSVFEIRVGSVTSPSNETDWGFETTSTELESLKEQRN